MSVAYHLAEAGWTDVLLVEKAGLTAGATSQAAGLVTAFNPSSTMLAWRRYSIELYGRLGAFSAVGSLRLASSPEQLKELRADGEAGARRGPGRRASSRPTRRGVSCRRSRRSRCTARSTCPATATSIRTGDVRGRGRGARAGRAHPYQNTRVTGFELAPGARSSAS